LPLRNRLLGELRASLPFDIERFRILRKDGQHLARHEERLAQIPCLELFLCLGEDLRSRVGEGLLGLGTLGVELHGFRERLQRIARLAIRHRPFPEFHTLGGHVAVRVLQLLLRFFLVGFELRSFLIEVGGLVPFTHRGCFVALIDRAGVKG
jgi:hypothetical protein